VEGKKTQAVGAKKDFERVRSGPFDRQWHPRCGDAGTVALKRARVRHRAMRGQGSALPLIMQNRGATAVFAAQRTPHGYFGACLSHVMEFRSYNTLVLLAVLLVAGGRGEELASAPKAEMEHRTSKPPELIRSRTLTRRFSPYR